MIFRGGGGGPTPVSPSGTVQSLCLERGFLTSVTCHCVVSHSEGPQGGVYAPLLPKNNALISLIPERNPQLPESILPLLPKYLKSI